MRKKFKAHKNLCMILSFFAIACLSISVMLYYRFLPGAFDQFLYVNRIAELKASIKHFALPQFGFNYLHGSAVMTLYPYINLIPAALLSFLIKSKILLVYATFGLYTFITLLISYYSSLGVSRSQKASYLFAVIYAMSEMYIDYTFVNADVAESAGLTWLPLIVFGFIKLMKHDKGWLELAIGLSLMIGTHVLDALIVIALIVVWSIANAKRADMRTLLDLGRAAALTLAASAFIWLPAILFSVNNPAFVKPAVTKIWRFSIPLSFLVKDSLIGRAIEGIGFFAILEIIMGIMFFKHFGKYEKQMFIISIIIILFCSKLFPWNCMPSAVTYFFGKFQFTTRFFIIPQLMMDYLFANTVVKLPKKTGIKNCLIAMVILGAIGAQLQQQHQIMSFNDDVEPFTQRYIHAHRAKGNVSKGIPFGSLPKNSKYGTRLNLQSLYRIDNNREYKNLLNVTNDPIIYDYWPSKKLAFPAISGHFSVERNDTYQSSPSAVVRRYGFDKFRFYDPGDTKITLPLFCYHGENIAAYDNHKRISIKSSRGIFTVRKPFKGVNSITLHPEPSYGIKAGELFTAASFEVIIGCLILVLRAIKKKYNRKEINYEKQEV